MAFPDNQLDDDIVKFLNDNVIINDVEWDGKVLEINESDLSQIHSECSRNMGLNFNEFWGKIPTIIPF